MDPDTALANLRAAVAEFRDVESQSLAGNPVDEAAHSLADAAEALDGLLSNGRYLPQAWKPAEPDLKADLFAGVLDGVVTEVREAAAAGEPWESEPVLVVFGVTEWDNGYFFEDEGLVYFADGGDPIAVEFGRVVDGHLTDLAANYAVGSGAGLTVNLRTGAVDFEHYMDHERAVALAAEITAAPATTGS